MKLNICVPFRSIPGGNGDYVQNMIAQFKGSAEQQRQTETGRSPMRHPSTPQLNHGRFHQLEIIHQGTKQ
jgi:hypothetical protein